MPYTLMKGFVWVLLAVLLGIVIGWLLRSVAANRQLARARKRQVDAAELDRLSGRVAELEPVVAERDRLRTELDECRAQGDAVADPSEIRGFASVDGSELDDDSVPDPVEPAVEAPSTIAESSVADAAPIADNAATFGDAPPSGDAQTADAASTSGDAQTADAASTSGDAQTADAAPSSGDAATVDAAPTLDAAPPPDVSEARAVLGSSIALDDLKAVEGIGPKIESLCNGIGIHTWSDLSSTETSLLRTMLADASSRFSVHDPSTWAEQAGLLAEGRWVEFKALTDGLRGGRTAD